MDKETATKEKAWRELGYTEKFINACRGLYVFYKTTKHMFIHIIVTLVVIIVGCYFSISSFEWIAIILSIGFVIVTEAFNTAIEIDIDLTSPQYHPYARDTKDVAAAAVLLSSSTAAIIGLIIFTPKIISCLPL